MIEREPAPKSVSEVTDPLELDYSAEALIARKRQTWPQASTLIADLVVRLFRLRDLVHESSRKKAKAQFNLTSAEFEVVVTLRTIPPPYALTPTELRKFMLITPGGLTKVMRNLEARNLVRRCQRSTDRRSWLLQLTPAGIQLAEDALSLILNDYQAQLSKGLTEKQMLRLTARCHLQDMHDRSADCSWESGPDAH